MALFKRTRREDVSDAAKLLVVDHEKVERIFSEIKNEPGVVPRQGLVAQLDHEFTMPS